MSRARRTLPDAARRGWCPSLARPMPTGDGLLARVHPPLGRLTGAQLRAVAEGARRHGNGHVDITARANLQVRGLTALTAPLLARDLAAVGLGDVRDDGGPQRLTLTRPLAGLDPRERIDGDALARAVEAVGLTVARLPAKTLVAIDGGTGFASADADILLSARGPGAVALGLAAADDPVWFGERPVIGAPGALALALMVFAATGKRRVRDLEDDERAQMAAAAGFLTVDARQGAPAASTPDPGISALGAGRALIVVEAPFGRCTAERLARAAALSDAGPCSLTASRGLALTAGHREAADVRDALAAQGFIVAADDPRRAVAACPGAPACAAGTTPVQDDAARLALAFAPFAAIGLTAHVSGCAKGCAHPGPADLTLVGSDGQYGAVAEGAPDAAPALRLGFEAALERVRRAATGSPSRTALRAACRDGAAGQAG